MSLQTLVGRTAVITGAASGIGRGMARHAAAAGMKVVAADVERGPLEDTVAFLRDRGGEIIGVPTDVCDPDAVEALAGAAYDAFGAVHLLHNNAGVLQGGLVWEATVSDFEWAMNVNFWGVLHGIRAFVPRMLEQEQRGDGDIHVVNTSSLAGIAPLASGAPYAVSKYAVSGLTECLAHDLRSRGSAIGVSCLTPGPVHTRIASSTRNRPGQPSASAQTPGDELVATSVDKIATQGGVSTSEAARIVFGGIQANDFWICTDDGFDGIVVSRSEAIRKRRLPPVQGA